MLASLERLRRTQSREGITGQVERKPGRTVSRNLGKLDSLSSDATEKAYRVIGHLGNSFADGDRRQIMILRVDHEEL